MIPVVISNDVKGKKQEKQDVAFYEHAMSLSISGDYFSLLNYVKGIQAIEEKLFIRQFEYKVLEYPKAELNLVIATVSADEKFIAL
ncbi:hypothetical protein [Pseudoalteromonas denitrificans]|uniref:MSHA biogenesis protein MshJ n=1 Tax=Pseudoalteromonas denitrificans DSM 6059 TaxID=1123010 RepID=A0A1I1DQQ6_9GAMM|nr:hypothetical protein [Pseudoalteromonas denitrificans]SFB77164.1 MSHA biogenesis protein MshJ [Pseudoalteromonas denitrificans DSM 6059]